MPPHARPDVRTWTVMVFMASDTGLELFADLDLDEMQKVGSVPGKMHVVAQLARRRFDTPIRFYIHQGRREVVARPRTSKDTGKPRVLASFLDWVRDNYPAKRYMLVLWGHSFGLSFAYEHALTIAQLGTVLADFAARLPSGKLDVLGCDSCSMSKAEAAYQFRNSVELLVAAQSPIPKSGWPYQLVLDELARKPRMSTLAVGDLIVQNVVDSYDPKVTLSSIKLGKGKTLEQAVGRLSQSLLGAARNKLQEERIRMAFEKSANSGGFERPLIDLGSLCRQLARVNVDSKVKSAARKTLSALKTVVADHRSTAAPNGSTRFHGLGIYAPIVAPGTFRGLQVKRKMYRELDLMRKTAWDDLVLPRRRRQAN